MNKQEYNNLLKEHICSVIFTKKSGAIRKMRCTLKQDVVAEHSTGYTGSVRTVPEHQVCVIDVEKQAWRSFDINDVISFEVTE